MADLYSTLKQYEKSQATKFPTSGTIHGIDGGFVDILVPASSTILRHVKCVGTPTSNGQQVLLTWENGTPTAQITGGGPPSKDVALIRGPQGPQGPEGTQGLQGPKGETGTIETVSPLSMIALSAKPANPPVGKMSIYPRTDNKFYKLAPDGTEQELGGGDAQTLQGYPASHFEPANANIQSHISAVAPHAGHSLVGHTHDYSKAIAKDPVTPIIGNGPYSSATAWTTFNITPYTSSIAKAAMLRMHLTPATPGTSGNSVLRVRKNGSSDTAAVYILAPFTQTAWVPAIAVVLVGLDAAQNFQYRVEPATNAAVYIYMDVLGYFE